MNELLKRNEDWVSNAKAEKPELLEAMAAGQSPEYLWIGCADSRVPAEVVTNSDPGAIFVQRNVANMVVHTDYNLLSVVNYAVKALGVKHIIICGHYGCGGVKAAMGNGSLGLLDNWVAHIKDVYDQNSSELDAIGDENARWNRFVELNVKAQVENMAKLSFIQEEWKSGTSPKIHGCVFDIADGSLRDLGMTIDSADALSSVYRYD